MEKKGRKIKTMNKVKSRNALHLIATTLFALTRRMRVIFCPTKLLISVATVHAYPYHSHFGKLYEKVCHLPVKLN